MVRARDLVRDRVRHGENRVPLLRFCCLKIEERSRICSRKRMSCCHGDYRGLRWSWRYIAGQVDLGVDRRRSWWFLVLWCRRSFRLVGRTPILRARHIVFRLGFRGRGSVLLRTEVDNLMDWVVGRSLIACFCLHDQVLSHPTWCDQQRRY